MKIRNLYSSDSVSYLLTHYVNRNGRRNLAVFRDLRFMRPIPMNKTYVSYVTPADVTQYSNHRWQFSPDCKLSFWAQLTFALEVITIAFNSLDATQTKHLSVLVYLPYRFSLGNPNYGFGGWSSMLLNVTPHQYAGSTWSISHLFFIIMQIRKRKRYVPICRQIRLTVFRVLRVTICLNDRRIMSESSFPCKVIVVFRRQKLPFPLQFTCPQCR